MNRFRQLKQKLIKSKRDSQKLQQLENDQKQVEMWLEKQLEYYGISKDNYRLREISNTVFLEDMGLKGCGEDMGQLRNARIDCEIQEKSFMKKTQYEFQNNQNNYSNLTFSKNKGNQQQTHSQQHIKNPETLSSKRIICKKNKINFDKKYVSSMNDIDSLLNTDNKNSQQTNIFKSQQVYTPSQQDKQKIIGKPNKQLDYYTLILQLTAQLNYSRLNKQQSNQKSILKQIKHLIEYIQNKSSSTNIPASKSSNKKSTHTFSSVYSNESLPNDSQGYSKMEQNVEEKRIIKYKLIQGDKNQKFGNLNSYEEENDEILNQNKYQQDQHNKTFGSDSGFEQNDREQEDQQNNKSIIDMVDVQQYHYQKNQNIHTEHNRQNSIMQNSPLSKITQHQSEYTDSINPSLKVSPTKPSPTCTPDKLFRYKTFDRQLYNKNFIQNRLQSQYSENKFNKKYETMCYEEPEQYKKQSPKLAQIFPNNTAKDLLLLQNELILKKLSSNNSNFEKTQEINPANNLFEQSLQYKKILYMLDSQIANNSDHKNRTISSLFGKSSSSSSQPNLYDESLNNNKFIKNFQRINNIFIESDQSAKSFIKEIFQSNSELGNKQKHQCAIQHDHNHNSGNKCLMNNLQKLFCNQIQLQRNITHKNNNNPNTRLHKRSYTCLQNPNGNSNPSSKNKNSPANLTNPLNQSLSSQSQNHIYDRNKYESIKTQYQDESIYHKISRNSYLTSQNHSKNYYQSSSQNQSKQNISNSCNNRENIKSLIVKKKKNVANNLQKEKENDVIVPMKFIVKKKKNTINKENICSVTQSQETSRIQQNNICEKSQIKDTYRQQSFKSQNQQASQVKLSDYELIFQQQNLTEQNSHHNKSSSSSQTSNISKKSIISNDSKSSNRSSKHIKYKVYKGNSTSLSGPNTSQKQDKRKVLKDIVSMLNSKYNKKITLGSE